MLLLERKLVSSNMSDFRNEKELIYLEAAIQLVF